MKQKLLDWFWPWDQLARERRTNKSLHALCGSYQRGATRYHAELQSLEAYNQRLRKRLADTMPAPVVKLTRCACATRDVEAIMPSYDIPPGKFDPSLYPQSNPGL